MKWFASILFAGAVLTANAITFTWESTPRTDGYGLYVVGTNTYRFEAGTNLVLDVVVPPGDWVAFIRSYSTNNSNQLPVEAPSGNEVRFYMPNPSSLEVHVDRPFEVPIFALSSNAVMRATVFLQRSAVLFPAVWSEGVPLLQYDLGGDTNAFYRTRLETRKLP